MTANPEPVPTGNDTRTKAALWFAEHGFGVFPVWSTDPDGTCRCPSRGRCDVPGKHPLAPNGFHDSTTAPSRIRTFMAAASRPNYGLVCPEGVFAWDVDGEGWQARVAALEAQHGPLPPTLRTDTANGQHVFLRWPDELPRPMHKMFGWVTRWGSGKMAGYVIGPRSVHATGKEYTPTGVYTIATLPEAWARAALAGDAPEQTIRITSGGDPSAVAVGGRHDFLRDQARFLAGSIRDPEVLFAAVWALNEKLPVPKDREAVQRAIGDALIKYPADPVEEDPDTGEVRRVYTPEGAPIFSPEDDDNLFPPPPSPVAYQGAVGEIVSFLMEDTDASPVTLLASTLAFCGALVPTRCYWHGDHTSSPFFALVGRSGIGRKGTGMYRVRDAVGNALGIDVVNRARFDGLASGEALVKALLNRVGETFGVPNGVLFEEEYATYLAAAGRENSNLDSRVRQVFDGKQLAHKRVSESIFVPEPYYVTGLVAITPEELRDKAKKDAFKTGSGNRWLWLPVVRRDVEVVSSPPILPADMSANLRAAHQTAIREAAMRAEDRPVLDRGPGVDALLSEYDAFLRAESVGLAADMTRRYAVIALRCAMVHAGVERSRIVTRQHVERCIALTEYARAGLDFAFGEALGDAASSYLLRLLRDREVLSQGEISKYFLKDILKRQAAIDDLCRLGLAEVVRVQTSGRPRSELRLKHQKGGFRDFRAVFGPAPKDQERGVSVEMGRERGAEGRESAYQNRKEGAQKGAEALGWLRPCRSYDRHQDHHRQTPSGWTCGACDEEEQ